MQSFHKSVLLQESIDLLNIRPGNKYIDATLGGGGHTFEILKRGGKVLGIDFDQEAINYVESRIKNQELRIELGKELILAKGNFKDIGEIAHLHNFEKVAGIIFDLGVSSHQFDQGGRGFSFSRSGPLDMRMDQDLSVKAADLVNGLTKGELYELFNTLGEERYARTIAYSIARARRIRPIEMTGELADLVSETVSRNKREKIHPATRVFQALRIAVNDELYSLRAVLPKAFNLLSRHGRMIIISYHSLEDRIVKNALRRLVEQGNGMLLTKKPKCKTACNRKTMIRTIQFFSIILVIIVFLSIVQAVVSNRIATTGVTLSKLSEEIGYYRKQNAILREEVLFSSSLMHIASEAARLGFVQSESEFVLTSPPLTQRR
ncbi:MAG: 16S rRNA (cytosine(1402)-N(4))-methyltransferase RsmH [Candidatus Levybacteria bacterium]|nr:16S rRNA (cytosine(1402)-N(4))-methyltransferase RsmH [Candidatus Levybacteria bacterium]